MEASLTDLERSFQPPTQKGPSNSSSGPTRRRTRAASDVRYSYKGDLKNLNNLNNLLNMMNNCHRLLRWLPPLDLGPGQPLARAPGDNFQSIIAFCQSYPLSNGTIQEGTCKQNDICSASCLTNDGPAAGSACVFPFNYMGISHTGCTTIDGDTTPWCSTQTDANDDHVPGVGAWGYCEASCPLQGLP